jgi:hypothetical protein
MLMPISEIVAVPEGSAANWDVIANLPLTVVPADGEVIETVGELAANPGTGKAIPATIISRGVNRLNFFI